MYKNSWLLPISLVLTLTIIHQTTTTTAETDHYCSNTTFTNESTYRTNLNTLFRTLVSNATNNPSGFFRTSVGNLTDEAIYGQYLCIGDQNSSSCHQCVDTATTTDLPKTYCPNSKTAVIWYAQCTVRYSNTSFFNETDRFPAVTAYNAGDIDGDKTRFMDTVSNMISNVIAVQASHGGPLKKYSVDFVNYSIIQPIYGMGQCTPDLSSNDCYQCLNSSLEYFLPNPSPGARVSTPSCIVRFETYPFFNLSYLPLSKRPSPPSSTSDSNPMINVSGDTNGKKKISTKVLVPIIIVALIVFSAPLILICIRLRKNKARKVDISTHRTCNNEDFTVESLLYNLATIINATNNFSDENKLGEGGFGSVYRGILSNGKLIAVKRLSANSNQGIREFETEVLVVAKLKHRNLVKLLGFCYTEKEKLLIYEYIPNKSLDNFIFDHEKRQRLDWQTRYNIIRGIARGLLYLHHESQLRIIHRDLKASNILLDEKMNPKISDFGTSRIFGVDHSQSNYTNRVVGTYGYMAPEYALHGQFSIKSDVYSFGVLVFEIISGRKVSRFNQESNAEDLLSHAWRQWKAETPLEFVDPIIRDSCSNNDDVIRCIQAGLLCVQQSVEDRPTMANVVLTLENYSTTLPMPEQSYLPAHKEANSDQVSSKSITLSAYEESVTELEPR